MDKKEYERFLKIDIVGKRVIFRLGDSLGILHVDHIPDTLLNLLVSNYAVGLDSLERMSGLTFVLAGVGGVGLSCLINCNGRSGCRDNTTPSMLSSS